MHKEDRRKRIVIIGMGLGLLLVVCVAIVAFVRYQGAIHDANVNVQPTFTGRPD